MKKVDYLNKACFKFLSAENAKAQGILNLVMFSSYMDSMRDLLNEAIADADLTHVDQQIVCGQIGKYADDIRNMYREGKEDYL